MAIVLVGIRAFVRCVFRRERSRFRHQGATTPNGVRCARFDECMFFTFCNLWSNEANSALFFHFVCFLHSVTCGQMRPILPCFDECMLVTFRYLAVTVLSQKNNTRNNSVTFERFQAKHTSSSQKRVETVVG